MKLARILPLLLSFALLAHAQEERSEAERLYADAWMAESVAGDLERALRGYGKAVRAEGPAAVRARALYRSAVVLQRLGRTDDAVRALERLSKEFPDRTELLEKARERMEEWTAVDLRDSFKEWYRRYVYSPEFQARVVDLVLKLGTAQYAEAIGIRQELLTIGDAAIPALREGLESSNETLHARATGTLVLLGAPPSVDLLVRYQREWVASDTAWRRLFQADPETKARLRRSEGDGPVRAALRAVAGPPEELIGFLLSTEGVRNTGISQRLLSVLAHHAGAEMRERVLSLYRRPDVPAHLVKYVMHNLQSAPDVPVERLVGWARSLPTAAAREGAAGWAVQRLRPESGEELDAVLALMFDDGGEAISPIAEPVLRALQNRARSELPWTEERVSALLRFLVIGFGRERRPPGTGETRVVLRYLQSRPATADLVAGALLAEMEHVDGNPHLEYLWSFANAHFTKSLGERASARWPEWDASRRLLWVRLLSATSAVGRPFLREHGDLLRAAAYRKDADRALQIAILKLLQVDRPDELLALYDLRDPAQAAHVLAVLEGVYRPVFRIWSDEAVAQAGRLLQHPSAEFRERTLVAFLRQNISRDAALRPQAVRLVDDPSRRVREWAVSLIAQWQSFEAAPHLVKALDDPDDGIRLRAAKALGRVGRAGAMRALARRLDDPSPLVRDAALESLEAIQRVLEAQRRWSGVK